jgi:hypothetical protein
MVLVSMRFAASLEVVPLDCSGKSTTFAYSDYIHALHILKNFHADRLAGFEFGSVVEAKFFDDAHGPNACLFAVRKHGLCRTLFADRAKAELHGRIAILVRGFDLDHRAWPALDKSYGYGNTVTLKDP